MPRKPQHIVLTGLLFWLMSFSCHAIFDLELNIIAEDVESTRIEHSAWYEDPSDSISAAEIVNIFSEFKHDSSGNLNFGISHSSFWIVIKLQLQSDTPADSKQPYLLELEFPLLARAKIFDIHEGKFIQKTDLGYDLPIQDRIIKHQNPLYPILLAPNKEYLLLLNVAAPGGSVQAPMKLWKNNAFIEADTVQNYLLGLFFGTLFAMVIYNGFLYINLRNNTYFYYVSYIFFSALAYLSLNGQGFLYLWPNTPSFNGISAPFLCMLTTLSGIIFFKSFTQVSKKHVRINRYVNTLFLTGLLLSIVIYSTHQLFGAFVVAFISIASVSVIVLSFYLWRNGSRQAGFFLLAWVLFVIGVLCFLSVLVGLIPNIWLTRHSLQLGSMTEAFLLSFALADKINQEKKEKYQALQKQHLATKRLRRAEAQLDHRALHSRTTGLPNRTLLRQRLDHLFSNEPKNEMYLVMVSLDNFHEINKTLGHRAGDAILKKLASRMSDLISNYQNHVQLENKVNALNLAHIEGTVFGFVLNGGQQPIEDQATTFLRSFDKPIEHQELSLDIEARIGISKYPEHGKDTDQLLKNAHIALETALTKSEKIAFYNSEENLYNEERLTRISELKSAINNNDLLLHFQPQLNLKTMQIESAEALVRWIHPEKGFIPPDDFIPIAERTGLIHPLTYFVCEQSLVFLKQLLPTYKDFKLSINISAKNLQDRYFRSKILELLKQYEIPANNIALELTETAVMTDPEEALKTLNQINQTGITLSIDDFGTGYSSLAYLKRLPVQELKIDRAFVMDMDKNKDDRVIVETTLSMAKSLGLTVVAEGIENETTLKQLGRIDCDIAQGYHIARPMPGKDLIGWLEQSSQLYERVNRTNVD